MLFVITSLQDIYNYTPETPRPYAIHRYNCSAVTIYDIYNAISYVECCVLYISTFRSICAVPSVDVLFSSLMSYRAFLICCSGTF